MEESTLEGFSRAKQKALTIANLTAGFSITSLAKTTFDWQIALSMIVASKFVYSDQQTVEAKSITDWGLDSCKFIDNEGTQCFIAASGDSALVTFRGTQERRDWLLNMSIASARKALWHRPHWIPTWL